MKRRSAKVSMGSVRPPARSERRFTSLARAILRLRFGGRAPRGHEEVARLLGISTVSAKRIEEQALRQLRLGAIEASAEGQVVSSGWDDAQSILADLARNEWDDV